MHRLTFFSISAVGLTLEVALSLLTPRFFPFLLVTLIICNGASTTAPIELMHGFYRYGRAMPFFQNAQVSKIVLYGFEDAQTIGRCLAVLSAWVAVMVPALWRVQYRDWASKANRG